MQIRIANDKKKIFNSKLMQEVPTNLIFSLGFHLFPTVRGFE